MENTKSHSTIIVGWKNGKVIYCRTFDDQNDRENMFAAFDQVRKESDSHIMTSLFHEVLTSESLNDD